MASNGTSYRTAAATTGSSELSVADEGLPAEPIQIDVVQSASRVVISATIPALSHRSLQLDMRRRFVKMAASPGERSILRAFIRRKPRHFGKSEARISLPCRVDDASAIITRRGNRLTLSFTKRDSERAELSS